jgi:thioredoxin-dependent peroxiredoxin
MALKVGDKIPNFSAKDAYGNTFESQSVIGVKTVVIYFYPKDDTHVCTQQACAFRDQYEDFKDLGAEVVGISGDSTSSHQKFASKYKLPFTLLSDSSKKIRNLFGVPTALFGLLPGRVTYVVDEKGIIQLQFDNLGGIIHIEKALEILKKLSK